MISIITTYYNRKELFYLTLKSISKSKIKDFELIVVDDGSDDNHRLECYLDEFEFMKIIRVEPKDKWYVNPCVPFNVGIREALGDIVLLQNPECLHVHDMLSYVMNNIRNNNYITFSTYSVDQNLNNQIKNIIIDNGDVSVLLNGLPQRFVSSHVGWYNHSIYRPCYYHFCSAITKKNLDVLGGFDERYAQGIAYDDDEFLERINRLGLNKIIVDDHSVIHQWHPTFFYKRSDFKVLHTKNKTLFNNITKKEKTIKVNNS